MMQRDRTPLQHCSSIRSIVAALTLAGLLLAFVPAQAESIEPAGQAKVTSPDQMKPYTETIPGTNVKFQMVPVPGGTFTMGSPPDEHEYREDHEGPRFKVKVQPFWMGKFEVTWDEFDRFLKLYDKMVKKDSGPVPESEEADAVSIPTPQYEEEAIPIINRMGRTGDHPAADMTQLAAKQYTKWLSKKTGRFYRLPTEAEWEYACRAGTQTAYYFGDDPAKLDAYGWYADNSTTPESPDGQYHKVGQKKPNDWGLYDMHGNLAEYVIDQYKPDHYKKMKALQEKLGGPVPWKKAIAWPGNDEQYKRIVRGGSWWNFNDRLRSAAREWSKKEWKEKDPQFPQSIWHHTDAFWVGFRVIRPMKTPPEKERLKFWRPNVEYVRELMMREGDKEIRVLIEDLKSQTSKKQASE